MHQKLKQDMRAANINVSEGDILAIEDMQAARDFLYFKGIDLGEHFEQYDVNPAKVNEQNQELLFAPTDDSTQAVESPVEETPQPVDDSEGLDMIDDQDSSPMLDDQDSSPVEETPQAVESEGE